MVHRFRGFFVVLEGPDGCGKGTQAKMLLNRLRHIGPPVVHTREPGGKDFVTGAEIVVAEELRTTMISRRDPQDAPSPMAELLIMAASRRQHVDRLIKPSLEAGHIVLSERYFYSTLAYQIGGRDLLPSDVWRAISLAVDGVYPNIVIILDVPAEIGLARKNKQAGSGGTDRFEMEDLEFHNRVRRAYRNMVDDHHPNHYIINGTEHPDVVGLKIWDLVHTEYHNSLLNMQT